MAENSKIEWCHHTFNPWIGCTKVGPGCDNCYAAAQDAFRKWTPEGWGPGAPRRRTSPANWREPLKWNRRAEAEGVRYRVFCASLADVFDNEVPDAWRMDLFSLIGQTPHLEWLLLTKRIGNVAPYCRRDGLAFDLIGDGRVWLGATVVNQAEADRDIPKLLHVPARVRWLSMEPLLGPVDLRHLNAGSELNEIDALKPATWEEEIDNWRDTSATWEEDFADYYGRDVEGAAGVIHPGIDWVVVGGESGPNARPMHPDWARSLRDQCQAAGVPFLFKQWGEWAPAEPTEELRAQAAMPGQNCDVWAWPDGTVDGWRTGPMSRRIGKKRAGRLLDDQAWDQYPEVAHG